MPTPVNAVVIAVLLAGSRPVPAEAPAFDVLIRGGRVHDGSGGPPRRADVGLRGDRIEAVEDLAGATAGAVTDATGLAVAPGFIDMLSWATEDLLADPHSQSDIRRGVTTEIFGEGGSYGPCSEPMKLRRRAMRGDLRYDITWTTLWEHVPVLRDGGRTGALPGRALRGPGARPVTGPGGTAP